ncbi:MAG: GDP-mannose 4,6-dehydratase [Candidatus Omnitrophica bacterium]|nr:GDP-mannose 4,6-dehydratase [Candidatus Omnitrophota bacterium]MBU4303668.1 GDP-mannose 4,6-dehydratase [Candidatus Omnitrophota bacterium]MBU4418433.1 GDP-mannose 4,6-dehydratase [Candidatus Omnitrophota bacterium]MBU4467984.1 GDP-mannose 4,6-dehydratase [Candidatus Omnitrophota bacterium]MCG2707661.1 GDP-mannose 4,6-dehydratase [Candidatus Omnitrophota bacterium]
MKAIDKEFWKNKKVLITGFEGFLGSHLVKALLERKAKVIGLDIKTFRKETILSSRDYEKIVVYQGSVTNRNLIGDILRKHSINIIFHLAAEAIVSRSQVNPLKAFKSNIAGTWEALEAARQYGNAQAIIVASSDKAYGSHKKLPYREDASLIANHPYDVSKSCADLIANTYFHTYSLPIAITRCGNIYGPGDFNFSRLIPDAMKSIILNRRLKIRSDGTFVRDYVYVDDIVAGYIKIAELMRKKNLSGEAFNLSGEKPITVVKLLKEISKFNFRGNELKYKIMNTAKYEIKEQYLSAAKARRVLGWKPRHSLDEGLKKTTEWYAEYFNKQ